MTGTPGNTPESELILAFARANADAAHAARARAALARGIRWELLLRTVELQGVAPLLHVNLGRFCAGEMPLPHAERLRRTCRGIAQLNLRLAGELRRLLQLFEERRVPAIPFKGPVLAVSAYRNLALRRFSDLDILVRECDLKLAQQLLSSLGYVMGYHVPGLEYHFVDETGRITVDLHQKIASSYFPAADNFDTLWARLQPLTIAGGVVRGLSTEDSAFMLCVHLTKDCRARTERLSEVCDVAELVAAEPALPWERVLSRARQAGGERIVLLALWLAGRLLGSSVPQAARQRIESDPQVASLGRIVEQRLLRQLDGSLEYLPHRRENLVEDSRFYLGTRERRGDKARYLLDFVVNRIARRLTPSEQDRRFVKLPQPLHLLYYLVRPIRVARDRLRESPRRRRWTLRLARGGPK